MHPSKSQMLPPQIRLVKCQLLGQVTFVGASARPAVSRLLEVSMKLQQKHHWKGSNGNRHTACTYHPAACTAQGFPVQPLLLGKRIR